MEWYEICDPRVGVCEPLVTIATLEVVQQLLAKVRAGDPLPSLAPPSAMLPAAPARGRGVASKGPRTALAVHNTSVAAGTSGAGIEFGASTAAVGVPGLVGVGASVPSVPAAASAPSVTPVPGGAGGVGPGAGAGDSAGVGVDSRDGARVGGGVGPGAANSSVVAAAAVPEAAGVAAVAATASAVGSAVVAAPPVPSVFFPPLPFM